MPEAVLNRYNQLDFQSQRSVLDYIEFLLSKIKPVEKAEEKEETPHRYAKFLDLAGKIDIDEDAIRELREISTL